MNNSVGLHIKNNNPRMDMISKFCVYKLFVCEPQKSVTNDAVDINYAICLLEDDHKIHDNFHILKMKR